MGTAPVPDSAGTPLEVVAFSGSVVCLGSMASEVTSTVYMKAQHVSEYRINNGLIKHTDSTAWSATFAASIENNRYLNEPTEKICRRDKPGKKESERVSRFVCVEGL